MMSDDGKWEPGQVTAERVNRTTYRVFFDWVDLKAVLERSVRQITGVLEGGQIKFDIKQLEEGSPPYSVDKWKAQIELVVDHEESGK